MTPFRVVRIVGIAVAFFAAFTVSQAVTVARSGGEAAPGMVPAIGVLSLFFLAGAWATEQTQGPELNSRKDLLWGLGSGGVAIVVGRLLS